MATVVEKMHPYDAAKAAGREPFKVRSLAEAEFGRKEMRLAEQEMPGLMALRKQHGAQKPLPAARIRAATREESAARLPHHGQPAHDDSDRGADRNAGRARRGRALGVVQHLLDP